VREKSPAAVFINGGIVVIVIAAYFFTCEYLLSRRNPQATWKDWPTILALTLTLIITAIVALVVEPNKSAALQAAGVAILAVVFSCAGAVVAARAARHKSL
jgi:cytochrome bd-type quinol oxidase subunit 2